MLQFVIHGMLQHTRATPHIICLPPSQRKWALSKPWCFPWGDGQKELSTDCAEGWDIRNDEHLHKETKRSETGSLSYMSQRLRDIQKTKRLKDSWAELDLNLVLRGLMELRNLLKGGIWIVCAEGDQINKVKNPQILWASLCLSYVPLKNPLVNFHTHHKQCTEKGINKQEQENIRLEGKE